MSKSRIPDTDDENGFWRGAGERHTLVDEHGDTGIVQPSGEPVTPKKPSRWRRLGNAILSAVAPFLAGGAGRPGR